MKNRGLQKLFSELSPTYELVNHILTFGLDGIWRKKASRQAGKAEPGWWLDICSGTGEMAANLRKQARGRTRVVAADFTMEMLAKIFEKGPLTGLFPVIADAHFLPFRDRTFSSLTISFATRNLHRSRESLLDAFKEFHRVLNPGGYFVNLETSQPRNKFIKKLFHFYAKKAIKRVGFLISGSKTGYAYLSVTIRRFYSAEELASLLYQTGFSEVRYRRLLFGIAAIHLAVK